MPKYHDGPGIEIKPEDINFSLSIITDFLGKDWIDEIEHAYRIKNSLEASLENKLHPISPWISAYRKHLRTSPHVITNNLIKLERLANYIKSFRSTPGFDKFAERLRDRKTFLPTIFELEAAMICQQMGYDIEFLAEKADRKTPEFIMSSKKGEKYEVECKSLDQKTSEAQKEDSILSNILKYARKIQKRRGRFYTFAIFAEESIGFSDYKTIIDTTIKSSIDNMPGLIEPESGKIEYKKLKDKEIKYATKYNGGTDEELPLDHTKYLIKLPLHHHIIEYQGNIAAGKCKELFSLHTTTPYTRNIISSIVTRFKTARNQISKDGCGCIFIKVPEEYFSEPNVNLIESAAKEIEKEFTPTQNTRISLVVIMSSTFEPGEDRSVTFMKSVFIYNPYGRLERKS